MTTTHTITARAHGLAQRLADVLVEIHDAYGPVAVPATEAAKDGIFEPGRVLIDVTEGIAQVAERIVAERTGVSVDVFADVIARLVDTSELDAVLEDLDPEREAEEDANVDRLRAEGAWSDEDEAERQLEIAERHARYAAVQS